MKKFLSAVLTVILIAAILFGIAYAIDLNRMSQGKPVMFSTWGTDYAPAEEIPPVNSSAQQQLPAKNEEPKEVEVSLYFADSNIVNLTCEKRTFANDENLAKAVVQAVIDGPESDNIYALIPADTQIISVTVSDGVCTVDLNNEFTKFTGGTSMENLAVHSLVNSLCSINSIDKVKINIEGNKNAMFGGHYSLEDPFTADMSLVK